MNHDKDVLVSIDSNSQTLSATLIISCTLDGSPIGNVTVHVVHGLHIYLNLLVEEVITRCAQFPAAYTIFGKGVGCCTCLE